MPFEPGTPKQESNLIFFTWIKGSNYFNWLHAGTVWNCTQYFTLIFSGGCVISLKDFSWSNYPSHFIYMTCNHYDLSLIYPFIFSLIGLESDCLRLSLMPPPSQELFQVNISYQWMETWNIWNDWQMLKENSFGPGGFCSNQCHFFST